LRHILGMNARSRFLGLAAFVILVGCASPSPIVRLYPRGADDVVWVSGRAVTAQEEDGVTVAAAFDHQTTDMIAFRLEVENDTGHRIEVSPDRVAFRTCRDEKKCKEALWVINPEDVLTALDRKRSREKAEAANDATAGGVLLFLSAVGDTASLASRHPSLTTPAVAADVEASAARSEATLSNVESQRALWSTAALRKTTVGPGRGVAGYVFIPIEPDARFVWLDVYQGQRHFAFCFKQVTHQVS
jgi:hypothetical protein